MENRVPEMFIAGPRSNDVEAKPAMLLEKLIDGPSKPYEGAELTSPSHCAARRT